MSSISDEHLQGLRDLIERAESPDDTASAITLVLPYLVDRRRAHALVERAFDQHASEHGELMIEQTTQPFRRADLELDAVGSPDAHSPRIP